MTNVLKPVCFARSRRWSGRIAVCLWGLLFVSGCGYVVGYPSVPGVRTVHVPTFTNATFRRGYELQLTEAVQKRIADTTPYRIVGPADADTRLIGHIRSIDKRMTNQSRFDDPRELELALTVEVRWENVRTGETIDQRTIPLDQASAKLLTTASFAPEAGQSLATATQDVVDQLSRQIVGLMESTW
ncbi:MAG: LPS assembly lipoprotein LptE [Planctomycetaceae bacterium]